MSIITYAIGFIIYFIMGMVTVYFISADVDRAYDNPAQGLFAILLWPLLLIYKSFQKLKQIFIKLTNLKNKQR
jgi:hypothetical protein